MDGAPAASMDGFTAVPKTPISRNARPAPPSNCAASTERPTRAGANRAASNTTPDARRPERTRIMTA